ncbi:MAG: hypothetical protein Q4D62_12440 [Planctomycetia bacterium]|nr:hypothetical protein [Planctomycetia bacterium]
MPENVMETPIPGFKMKLYRSPISGDAWVEVGGVQSVSVDDVAREEIEIAMRGSEWKRIMPGMMEAMSATFKMVHNIVPGMETLIRNDILNGTATKYAMVNGDITASGTEGWSIPVYVTQMNRSEELSEIVANDIKVKLGFITDGTSLVEPEWLTI